MKLKPEVELQQSETEGESLARTVTSPECLSASVLTICQKVDPVLSEMVSELKLQAASCSHSRREPVPRGKHVDCTSSHAGRPVCQDGQQCAEQQRHGQA